MTIAELGQTMDASFKVLTGPRAGQELPLKGPKFLIGRAEDCHVARGVTRSAATIA